MYKTNNYKVIFISVLFLLTINLPNSLFAFDITVYQHDTILSIDELEMERNLKERIDKTTEKYSVTGNDNSDFGTAMSYLSKGKDLYALNKFDKAKTEINKAIKAFAKQKNRPLESQSIIMLGHISWKKGAFNQALIEYKRAEKIQKKINRKDLQAELLQYMGIVYRDSRDYDKSLQLFLKSLDIAKSIHNDKIKAKALNYLAGVYWKIGNYNKALTYYQESLSIREKMEDYFYVASSHSNIGILYKDMGSYRLALYHHFNALKILKQWDTDKDVAYSLNNIGNVYWKMAKFDSSLIYYKQSLNIRINIGEKAEAAKSLDNIGNVYESKHQYNRALNYYNKANEIRKNTGNISAVAHSLNKMGSIYLKMSKYLSSLEYYTQALDIFTNLNNDFYMAKTVNNIAMVYKEISNYKYALEYLNQSFDIYKSKNNKVQMAFALNSMGSVYWKMGDNTNALNYYMKALRIREEIGNKSSIASSFNNIGLIYRDQKDIEKSIQFYQKAYDIYNTIGNEVDKALVLNNIGDVYSHFNKFNEALQYFNRALKIREQKQDTRGIAISTLNIGKLHSANGRYKKAEPYLNKAMLLAIQLNEGVLIKTAGFDNYKLYKKLNNSNKALKYYLIYSAQKDTILNSENIRRIADLQIQIEINKKERVIDALKRQKEVDELKLKYHRIFGIILLIFFGLVLFIAIHLFINLKNKKRTNHMLERVFSVVAHDLRSPVSTLSNLSDLLNQPIADLNEGERNIIIKHMDGITKSTVSLLDNLLEWSKKQRGMIGYDPQIIKIKNVLNESLVWIEMIARNKDITIINEIPEMATVYADRSAVSLLFRNLIINAIKFSPAKGTIRIFANEDAEQMVIGIADNGVGMSPDKLKVVLSGSNDISKNGTMNETGTGLGIRLCKEFVIINKGKLWAESIENKQTIFYFSLPKEIT